MSAGRSLGGVEVAGPLPLGARLTRSWSRTYTYGLPADVALARRDEIAADLHDQLVDTAEFSSAAVSRVIATRMLLGIPADLSWRSEQARAHRCARRRETAMTASHSPYRNLALAFGAVPVAWGLLFTAKSATESLRVGGSATAWWVLFLSATLAGVVGLILLALRRAVGAALLAVASLGTTLPLRLTPLLWVAGIALAAFFVTVLMQQRRVLATPLPPPVA